MADLRFVNAGTALENYDKTRDRADERAWQRASRERTMQAETDKDAVDVALREAVGTRAAGLAGVSTEPEDSSVPVSHDSSGGVNPKLISPTATAQRPSWRAPVIQRLASTRGGGAQAMTLLKDEESAQATSRTAARAESREERELSYRGLEQFNKSMKIGDIDTARVVNARFKLGIPGQAFENQRVFARLRGIASTIHDLNIRGETAAEVMRAALENPDLPIEQAVQRGMAAGAGRADKGDLIETSRGWYNTRTRRYEEDPEGNTLMPTDRRLTHPPRAPARGPGGAGSGPRVQRTLELADGTIRLIMTDGTHKVLTDAMGNPARGQAAARRAASLVGKMVSPIQTREERSAAVREGVRISDEIGGIKPPAVVQPAPRDPRQRQVGTVYSTPKGNLKWMGDGWAAPNAAQ